MTTLIFPKNQGQCASFSINVAILFLSFKRTTIVPNKLIDSHHYNRLRRKTLTAFHSLSHFTLTTTRLNLSFFKLLQNDSETGTIFSQPPLISFQCDKNRGNFLVNFLVHFKPMINLELSNALAHNAKLVLPFITYIKYRDPRDPLRSLITLLMSFNA